MKRYSFSIAFGLGALAVAWVAAAVASSHLLVLGMAAVIGAVYVFGALELRQYRATSAALSHALAHIPPGLQHLNDWLITLPSGLQNPVRQRVEGERVALPGPALTPYLVGLLVMLGMLGTFLGMVVTLNGAVFALEGSSNVAGIRAAFSEPIKGLGLAFGTSVAGVASSAMLGLMSSLARRERAQAGQALDTQIATRLRHFSLTHQRQETFAALQQQAQALPQVVQQLQSLMTQLAQTHQQSHDSLQANQHQFHQEVHSAYTGLAQSVDQSLRTGLHQSLNQSLQWASEAMTPLVQATMAQLAEQAQSTHTQWLQHSQQQLAELHARFGASADGLVTTLQTRYTEQQAQHSSADLQRLEAWKAALHNMASTLGQQWQASGTQTLAQQQSICDTLQQTAQDIGHQSQTQAAQTLAEVTRLMASSEELVRARIATEAQWAEQHSQRADELGTLLRTELSALRDAEEARGQAAVARLGELHSAVTTHLSRLGTALEDPITRLIDTAAQAPKAAAEVIAQLRQEMSLNMARDNALLDERTRILQTLSTLLDAINHASTEQRSVIDALVNGSAITLNQAHSQFTEQVGRESAKLGDIAAQVTASAVDVASLGESFGMAVLSFSETNDKLMAHLQRIEQAMDKSMTRSDEQLAYYVAQAREIIDLSMRSQQDVLESLQNRASLATEGAV